MDGGNIPAKVDEAVEEVIPPISPSAEDLRASPGLSESESVKKTEDVEQIFKPVPNGQMVEQHEMKGKKEKQVAVAPKLPMLQLWKYANKSEQIMIGFAAFFSLIGGALAPAVILIMGKMLGTFGGSTGGVDIFSMEPKAISAILAKSNVVLVDNFMEYVLDFVWFGIALLFCVYISHALWVWSAELQGRRIRIMYVESILHQDMGWHDANTDSLTSRLALDTANITEGLGEKAGLVLEAASSGITGVVIALTKGWKLTLVMIACLPLIAIAGGIMIVFLKAAAARAQAMYASAGGVAEQAIASIRTVYAFSMMERFVKRFDEKLVLAYNADCDKARAIGVGVGSFFFLLFSVFGLSLWYGSTRVIAGEYPGQDIMVIFSAMMIGTFALINIPTSMSVIATAQASAAVVYEVIDRKPLIDTRFTGDKTNPQELKGKIEMRNVKFHYPTRPDVPILQGLSCQVLPGESIAFVGPSGSGKSTSVSLVQRFYDAVEGTVFIDDRPIKEYDLSWLRQQIGVVGQEPVLFNLTVKQNILLGCTKPVSAAKLIEVCKMANCHNFILNLPDGYDSMVGQSGGMLSGGQKQRIAIARALIKDPKILLLDEATSALDTASERLVQKALDKAAMSRTTIIIAHRLSTIRNCNTIVVMDKGTLVEQGDHNSLLNKKGLYFNLVEKQKIAMGIRGDAQSEKDDLDARAEREAAEIEKAERESKQSAKAEITGVNTDGMLEIENAKELSRMATARRKEEKAKEQAIAKANEISTWTVVKLMKTDYPKLIAGVFFTAIAGAAFPGYALLLSKLITIFLSTNGTALEADRQFKISPGPMSGANLYCFLLLIIGLGAFIGTSIGRYSFGMAGASLTRQLRRKLFSSFMHQEAGFFDLPGNTTGVLASRLATDAANVTSMVTDAWGELMQLISCCVTGLAIGFSYAANMTGIMLLMVPFLVYGGYSRGKAMKGFEDKTKKAYEEGCEVAAEAIRDIRTVTSLTREGYFVEKFAGSLDDPLRLGKEKAFLDSVGAGVEKSVMQFANAVGFYAGLRLIQDGNVRFEGMLISIIVTMITCQQIGQASTFLTNLEKGKKAAANIFIYLDRVSKIDPDTPGLTDEKFEPDFEFKDIAFEYPARPDQKIFSGEFNLKGNVNQTIALVGPSGCGKSTTIGMLQRWYDPSAGTVSVGKINTKEYQLKDGLRKHMALVGQEPVLFDMSIRENIEWGTDRVVTDAEIIEAAQLANIHTFVEALPDKYETRVGLKGGQLSGGQKQRIAIARALIRKPKLLLLDEATSALDSESEKIVQTAIDRAAQGRTTITIAHRLSTIQNADVIAVVSGGRVVEIGKHQELIALKGLYAGLVQQQDLSALQ